MAFGFPKHLFFCSICWGERSFLKSGEAAETSLFSGSTNHNWSVSGWTNRRCLVLGWIFGAGTPPAGAICRSKMLAASGGRARISISHLGEVPDWPSHHHRAPSMAYILPSEVNDVKGKTTSQSFWYKQSVTLQLYQSDSCPWPDNTKNKMNMWDLSLSFYLLFLQSSFYSGPPQSWQFCRFWARFSKRQPAESQGALSSWSPACCATYIHFYRSGFCSIRTPAILMQISVWQH